VILRKPHSESSSYCSSADSISYWEMTHFAFEDGLIVDRSDSQLLGRIEQLDVRVDSDIIGVLLIWSAPLLESVCDLHYELEPDQTREVVGKHLCSQLVIMRYSWDLPQ
jgi:hypothetical protein